MSLVLDSHDILIYIDNDTIPSERDNATALINRDLKRIDRSQPHASLPPIDEPTFSELVTKELEQIASGKKRKAGIDLSRYNPPDEPAEDADVQIWRDTLRGAYSSSTYLSGRQVNLKLLEERGKNGWLISNAQSEQVLKGYQQELERLKQEIESVNKERKAAQEGSKPELDTLQASWQEGMNRLVKVQVATDELRQELQ